MQEIIVDGSDVEFFTTPTEYKQQLLLLIEGARQRIFITALYLQDDDAVEKSFMRYINLKQTFLKLKLMFLSTLTVDNVG